MIAKVQVSGGFVEKLPAFQARSSFELIDGVNVIFGPNGCGKSTLIIAVGAVAFVPLSGGWSRFVQPLEMMNMIDGCREYPQIRENLMSESRQKRPKVDGEWDGVAAYRSSSMTGTYQEIYYLMGGGTTEGLLDLKDAMKIQNGELSKGQARAFIMNQIRTKIQNVPDLTKRSKGYDKSNSAWQAIEDRFIRYTSTLPRNGRPTLIMDEPENGLDFAAQRRFWESEILALASERQIVIATHSPFAILCRRPEWNFIDMIDGYVEESRKCLIP